jgi:hypothetical protein
VLKALWSVKVIWQDLNIATKIKLTNIITEERTPFTVRTFVSVFFSLSHIQATYLQIGDTNIKKIDDNFQEKKEKNVILQQNENLQKVFLVGLSKFSSALNKKQLSNVFYILRVRNFLWASLSSSTRNVLLGKIQIFSGEFSSREIISILSGLVSCETLIPNSELSKSALTNANNDENGDENKNENENEVEVRSEKTEINQISVKATLKSVLSAISRICNEFTEIEAKSVVNNLSKIGLFHDLDDRTKNILYSKMIENPITTKPSTPPSSTSTSTFTSFSTISSVDEYDDILLNSRIKNEDEDEDENENEGRRKNGKHSDTKKSVDEEMKKLNDFDFKKNTEKKDNYNYQNDKIQHDTRDDNIESKTSMKTSGEDNLVDKSEVIQETSTTTTTTSTINTAHVRTGSESVRAFEWVKALVRSKATWSDLR